MRKVFSISSAARTTSSRRAAKRLRRRKWKPCCTRWTAWPKAVVAGLPDPILGQAIAAMVVRSQPDLTERAVLAHCARHLEDFMVPKTIVFRDELPRTDTGKVSRRLAAGEMETIR